MGDPAPIKSQAERAASLAHAAECLARAAAKLSEAARAMSTVAGVLSQGNAAKSSTGNESEAKPPPADRPDAVPASQITAPEDDGVGLPQPHRLLLDDEVDVLLVLCSLVYDRPKVVCYFACSAHSLKLYKSLIDGIAQTNAIVPSPSNKSSIASCYKKFLKETRSIILLSEDDIPTDPAKDVSDYTVIHVGWPVSKNQYVAQRRAHQASTNILLAYSGDKDLYPSGSAIMSLTEAWPGDTGGFRASADILRPLFEERLSELSFEMKEEAYLDWIHSHSRQGSRSVTSWTPSTLASRANRFILGPLAYRSPGALAKGYTRQTPLVELLPEVSAEFVTQHELQPAVDEGLLRVEADVEVHDVHEPGSNSASRWSAEDTRPNSMREAAPRHPQTAVEGNGNENQANAFVPPHRANAPPEPPRAFELATGQTYFALEEEFDAIPLICFLTTKFKKTIIFLDGAMLQRYRDLFRQLMRLQVLMIKPGGPAKTMEEVSLRFVASESPVTLLIEHTINEIPFMLQHYTIGCWMYWGHDSQIHIAQRLQSQLKCALAALLIPSSRRDRLVVGMSGFKEHPQASVILARGSQSMMESERELVRSTLLAGGRIIQGLYSTRIASLRGESQQGTRSAEEIVHIANLYAARVLLHGTPEDGSAVYPPIARRPSVEQGVAGIFRLQPAVFSGLLYLSHSNHRPTTTSLGMPSQLRGNISTDPRLASLTSLADAADALTKAVATLAAAARATAEAFAQDLEVPRSPSPEESHGINLGRGSDLASEIEFGEKPESDIRQDIDLDDGEEWFTAVPVGDDSNHASTPMNADTGEQDSGSLGPINSPYRLLVDSEADVLLFVCALIDKRQKVVCYMPCGTPPLKTYIQLMEKVTEAPIYALNSSTSLEQNSNYLNFLNSSGSVLLIPESLSPRFKMEGDNSWVIHVGWPVSEAQYTTQRRNHRAHNNVLVACSGDQTFYPSGNKIVELTEPWPKDGPSFRASVSILRSLYEVILSEIPLDTKSPIYMDYIQFHGVHGPRHVESWTPSVLVQRANDYLMKVWLWSGDHTGGDVIPLPEVSPGFITENNLQSAVEAGIIQVEADLDEAEPTPSLAQGAPIAQEEIPYGTSVSGEPPFPHTLTNPRPESVLARPEFEPTTGLTFFPYVEEFDIIPLICFIAGKYNKVICFLEGQGALRTYHDLFGRIAGRTVFFPKVLNDNHAIEEAVVRFISAANPAILLLAHNTTNLPFVLSQSRADCCIYWGFSVVPLQQAKQNRPLINCDTTIIIMMGSQLRGLSGAHDLRKHPSGGISTDLTENSALAPIRTKTRMILAGPRNKSIIDGLYTNRVYSVATLPRRVVSAQEVARRVNQYAARVLLHGNPADGSATFPPVAGRPTLPRPAVEKFNLQPAVDAGLLTVGN